jgi:hypothetical protein
VLEWPDGGSSSARYGEAAAAAAVAKLLLGLDAGVGTAAGAFAGGWADNLALTGSGGSGGSGSFSGGSSDGGSSDRVGRGEGAWSERSCWAVALRALLASPAPNTALGAAADGTKSANDGATPPLLLPLTLAAVEPFLSLFIDR